MLHHGGNLLEASRHWGIAPEQWLDLSTGISPISYPIPQIPPGTWQNLPQEEDGLIEAAQAYLGTNHLLPTAGSQAVINLLPYLRARSRVVVLENSYLEHMRTWQLAGHEVLSTKAEGVKKALKNIDVLILANPDNPSAHLWSSEELTALHEQLKARGGWLILDEAFIDATPEKSMAHLTGKEGLIILRSFGKFFGLAGVRGGFIMAWSELLKLLQERLYPWHLTGPSRLIMKTALLDRNWQEEQKQVLLKLSRRLELLLQNCGYQPSGTALFQFIETDNAAALYHKLAREGILTRLYTGTIAGIRLGLPPGSGSNWLRLEKALTQFNCELESGF